MAISALTTPVDEPLDVTLRRAAEAVAIRMGARVEVECVGSPKVDSTSRQALERIVREASSNAVKHGQANHLRVAIHADGALRVAITDDGRGFDTEQGPKRDSFGMISMRERAEGLGGSLRVTSQPGEGATIEVTLPSERLDPGRGRRSGQR
jgi:signal transduction histidine kinase